MAAVARSVPQVNRPERTHEERQPANASAIVKLALLHAEAEETARLANLLGRSPHAAIALPVLALLTLGFADGISLARASVWFAFVALGSLAIMRCYAHAIGQPFQRPALKAFAKEMSPILLYTGFAWGAGAFLALPAGTNMFAAILFVAGPVIAIVALLRERDAAYLFLAPCALLACFASVLTPFAGGALTAGLILVASSALTAAMVFSQRSRDARPAMLMLS
ncbi:MAG: hypothetical protein WCA81_08350 [Rhizomicrobium sp.]